MENNPAKEKDVEIEEVRDVYVVLTVVSYVPKHVLGDKYVITSAFAIV